jgi:hypothetical protein
MGASGWEYVVRYRQDLGAALDALRRQVFAGDEWVKPDFYGDVFNLPEPSSVDGHPPRLSRLNQVVRRGCRVHVVPGAWSRHPHHTKPTPSEGHA